MSEITSEQYYMFNHEIMEASSFAEICQPSAPSVYEVIRIMDGIPLFLEEHYSRLVRSLESIHQQVPFTEDSLKKDMIRLADVCGVENINIKLILYGFGQSDTPSICLYFIPTHYPTEQNYEQGVPTDLFHAERKNPQAKIINNSLRDATNAVIAEKELYEVLLVNEQNAITEGSRSNVFFIQGDSLYTAPIAGVLPGITRSRILRVCEDNSIPVVEREIPVHDLASYDAAFISGTSPKVLPISRIGALPMDVSNKTLQTVMRLYNEEISHYLLRNLN